MRIIITGGTGLIGSALAKSLVADGHEVIVLTRDPKPRSDDGSGIRQVKWDAATAKGWGHLADGADAIVNLAGESIYGKFLLDGRWTEERKKKIYSSRINAGRAVVEAVRTASVKPKALIQASGVDYYGPRKDEVLTEKTGPGTGFLAQVCFDWEASTAPVEALGVRRAVIRTGLVLSNDGGAWPLIVLPFRLFAGGKVGSGKQYWPWIHVDDEVSAIRFLLENANASGVFNLTAPTPLTSQEFAATLGKVMGRPALFPVPAIAMKTALGELSTMVLHSHRAVPQHLVDLGYTFKFAAPEAAFKDLT